MRSLRCLFISFFFFFSASLCAQAAHCVCCTENHQAFDFWIGNWSVTNQAGVVLGTNRIEKLQDNCVLQEHWTGSSGSTGTSINFFNSLTKQWEQLWVDNQGTTLKLKGNREGNKMILSSDISSPADRNAYINRITWTLNEDGTVRQLWEILEDKKVVNVAFDGLYTKVK